MLYTFDHVLAEIRAGKIEPDFALFEAMLSYVQDFPDRFHHPKEDEVLFPLMVKRAPEVKDTIAEPVDRSVTGFDHRDWSRVSSLGIGA